MLNRLFLVCLGFGMEMAEDFDALLVKVLGDMIDIQPICELD